MPLNFVLHVFMFTIGSFKNSGNRFPYPLRTHAEGLWEFCCRRFPFFGLARMALCARTFGQQYIMGFPVGRSPRRLAGGRAGWARLLIAPPLIHVFFGQQGYAGLFTLGDHQLIDGCAMG